MKLFLFASPLDRLFFMTTSNISENVGVISNE